MPIKDRLSLPGVVEPWVGLEVVAEVPGKVIELPAREGDFLKEGELIARLDPRDYENEVASVKAEYDLALKALKRAERLNEQEIIPKVQYDEAVARAEGLEASLKNSRLRLDRSAIKAPISGVLDRLDVEDGAYLNAMQPVAKMLDISRVKVVVGIPESDVDAVRKLRHFDVTLKALGGRKVKGSRLFISKSPETQAHLYRLEAEVQNPGGDILPGMFAEVEVVKDEVRDAVSVPLYAVISRGDEQLVYVEEEGKAHVRMVRTGILEGWRVQITSGLAPADRVVVVGHRSVDEGQEVNVMRTITDPGDLFR